MKYFIITLFLIIIIVPLALACECPIKTEVPVMIKTREHNYKEADYVKAYCNGQIEYILNDKTRIDCLTNEYAIEFDWAKKWAESVGQSLYYSKMTGKKPAVAIIMKSSRDKRYIRRIKKADKSITIFNIKAY